MEDNWKKSIPDDALYYRPPDAAQSFGENRNLRFSSHSPCDCMLFDGYNFFTLELKSSGQNTMSFERCKEDKGMIHWHQIQSLLKFSKFKNVVSGFILDFRLSEKTYFIHINDFVNLMDRITKKSFNEKDLCDYCFPMIINKRKLKVNYRYDVVSFMDSFAGEHS